MSDRKMIVGLGNPGAEYVNTRHNVGFKIVDLLAELFEIEVKKRKFSARFGQGQFESWSIILLKPWQFMNVSGQPIATAAGFYKLDLTDLLVVLDDMWLKSGSIRLRASGSAGGHNGLADIIEKLGTDKFSRLRVGIGQSTEADSADYVLDEPTDEQKPLIEEAIVKAKDACLCWIRNGVDKTMSEYNPDNSG